MGPRVLGFSYPGHRFPPGPAQPGHSIVWLGRLEVYVDNKSATDMLSIPRGPVQPGPSTAKNVVARRSPLLARCQCAGGMHTWERSYRNTPATPGVLRMPSVHSSSIFQAGVLCYQPHRRCITAGFALHAPSPWHGLAG
eukprot:2503231-Amphidinium_carterae.1